MTIKHLAGRHDQKKHAGTVRDIRTDFVAGQASDEIERLWQQSQFYGQASEFSQKLSDWTGNDVLVDTYSMGIRLGDNSDKSLTVFPLRDIRIVDGNPNIAKIMSIGTTQIVPDDERYNKGIAWLPLKTFDGLTDDEARELLTSYDQLENVSTEIGCNVIESDSGSFPVQLAAAVGFKLDWMMFQSIVGTVPDPSDRKYNDARKYDRKIDFLVDHAQEFLHDKYGLEVKYKAGTELDNGATVADLLNLKHPLYDDVPLFEEYLSQPHAERFQNVEFDKRL